MAAANVEEPMMTPGEAYGTVEPTAQQKPAFRFSFNSYSVLTSLILPWVYFMIILGLASCEWHATTPWTVWCLEMCFLTLNLVLLYWAFHKVRLMSKGDDNREPTWVLFMALSFLFAWIAGMVCGNVQFGHSLQMSFQWNIMNSYEGVDVATTSGESMMDAAQVRFAPMTEVALDKASGFRNRDTYCVAPLQRRLYTGEMATMEGSHKQNFDFWVVGLNCCTAHKKNSFNCGMRAVNTTTVDENGNVQEVKNVQGGLRMLRDQDRAYYRLAISQAEAEFGIKVNHPLMFYWVTEDVKGHLNSVREGGMKWYAICVIVHFMFQVLCVRFALWHFANQSRVVRRAFG